MVLSRNTKRGSLKTFASSRDYKSDPATERDNDAITSYLSILQALLLC